MAVALVLITEDRPWVYEKENKPGMIISTPEALAVVLSLKFFYLKHSPKCRSKVPVLPM